MTGTHKILFFSHESSLYGAPRSLLDLVDGLKDVYQVQVVSAEDGTLIHACAERGIPVKLIGRKTSSAPKSNGLRVIHSLIFRVQQSFDVLTAIRRWNPALVYVNTCGDYVPVVCAWLCGKPRIVHVREGKGYVNPRRLLWAFRSWFIFGLCKNYICVSKAIHEMVLQRRGKLRSHIQVIYNGIDALVFRESAKQCIGIQGLRADVPVVGFVGSLVPNKRLDVFLSAAARLLREGREVQFVVLGGAVAQFDPYLKASGLSDELGHRLFYEEFREFPAAVFGQLDIFCMTSNYESFGRTNIEAALMEVPTVATRTTGNTETVIDGETGLLFEKGDADALAEKIAFLLENPERRRSLGLAARQRAETLFSRDRYVKQVQSYIDDLLVN